MQYNLELDKKQANPIDIGWMTGMIEAEGSFVMNLANHKRQIQARISFTNTDKDVLTNFCRILDEWNIKYYEVTARREHFGKKLRTDIQVYRFDSVNRLMEIIYPYLSSKKHRAACVWNFVQSRLLQYNGRKNLTNAEKAYTPHQWRIYEDFRKASESIGLALS